MASNAGKATAAAIPAAMGGISTGGSRCGTRLIIFATILLGPSNCVAKNSSMTRGRHEMTISE